MSLTINELIGQLQEIREKFGNIQVLSQAIHGETALQIKVITENKGVGYDVRLESKVVIV